MTNESTIRAVKRSFDIVEALVDTPKQGVSVIADRTGLAKSTVHSHLGTLRELGFVRKDGSRYSATTKLLDLAGRQRKTLQLYREARPIVDELAKETDGYADLYVEESGMGVLLHLATGGTTVELGFAYEGLRHPLHTNASGKSILAFRPEEEVAEILDQYRGTTERGVEDEAALFDILERIREQKYAVDVEEALVGMSGVGAPVLDRSGHAVAGLGVYKPAHEMTESYFREELPRIVRQKANIVEVNLNYS